MERELTKRQKRKNNMKAATPIESKVLGERILWKECIDDRHELGVVVSVKRLLGNIRGIGLLAVEIRVPWKQA